MDYRAVGQRLRALRRARGLRQVDVAEQLGMTDSNVSLIESGRVETPIKNLEAYAALVGARVVIELESDDDPEARLIARIRSALPRLSPANRRAVLALVDAFQAEHQPFVTRVEQSAE